MILCQPEKWKIKITRRNAISVTKEALDLGERSIHSWGQEISRGYIPILIAIHIGIMAIYFNFHETLQM